MSTNYLEIPLHLCQVLEEEFESLHGTSGAGDSFAFNGAGGRPVTVREDWLFHEGHVDAESLAAALRDARAEWLKAHAGSAGPSAAELPDERELRVYLAFKHPELLDGTRADYPDILNGVLLEKNDSATSAFRKLRFERLTLDDETRSLMALGWEGEEITFRAGPRVRVAAAKGSGGGVAEPSPLPWSDLVRFRRRLLENGLGDYVTPIYDLRLERVVQKIHGLGTKRTALCLSGGGIRSGTTALGVIQSLAGRGLLDQFDYLSTVSGGGYIGGWLSAWIHRHRNGLAGVIGELRGEARASKLDVEPEPLRHLRDYSNFVTPRTGLLSADTWSFAVIYIRNLLLNWVVLIPLLASVLMVPRVANAVVLAPTSWRVLIGLAIVGGVALILLKPDRKALLTVLVLGLGAAFLIIVGRRQMPSGDPKHVAYVLGTMLVAATLSGGFALAYMRLSRPSNAGAIRPGSFWDRHRDQTSFLLLCMLPLTVSAVLLTTFWAWLRRGAGLSSVKEVKCVGFASGWDRTTHAPDCLFGGYVGEFSSFILYGLALGVTGWLIYVVLAAGSWERREVGEMYGREGKKFLRGVLKNAGRELIVTLCASLIGAILLYALATKIPIFYDPVVASPITTIADTPKDSDQAAASPCCPSATPAKPKDTTRLDWTTELYTTLAFPAYLLVFFAGITLFVGFTSRRSEKSPREKRRRRGDEGGGLFKGIVDWLASPFDRLYVEDEDREWLARASAWVFIVIGGWLAFSALVVFGPMLYVWLGVWLAGAGGVTGLTSVLGGKSALTPGNKKTEGKQSILATLGLNLIVVAAFVFFCVIVITISTLTGTVVAWLATYFPYGFAAKYLGMDRAGLDAFAGKYPFASYENVLRVMHYPSWLYLIALALGLHAVGRVFARLVNLNKFSLHAGYRDRIIRAFLGASRLEGERRANPFTGFDPRDNLTMEEMRPLLLRESDFESHAALARFAAELDRAARPPQPGEDKYRHSVAAFLRDQIERMNGESRRYFNHPAVGELSASFRSALFADLNNVLQSVDLPARGQSGDAAEAEAPRDTSARPARIRENRERLSEAFPDYIIYPPRPYRLLHVVNMALNLVGGDKLAWQQRRAESFTSSPLHSGSLFVGYRRTRDYGGTNGITLGTAVATSGAAASSNMGYFSPSVFVTFVLTFFNARLGWWLGNPGVHGADTFYRSHPEKALSPIIDEAFGLTDDENPYVLLSDGGHFENLGLYEMVLRRCRYIFVVDGSADPSGSYDDLGSAVRKIRIDFGIDVEFKSAFRILSRPDSLKEKKGAYCAVGDINYGGVDGPRGNDQASVDARKAMTGKLVYIKPAVYGDEPRDVFNYTRGNEEFPHESTADQFFDEPQFESHRMLGAFILERLYGEAGAPATLESFANELDRERAAGE